MQWLIDFDDTLAVGPITWAFEHVFPQMIEKNNLTYEPALMDEAILLAQRQGNQNVDEKTLVHDLFHKLGWPAQLEDQFLHDVYYGYTPSLFDDTTAFLERLAADSQEAFVISNNDYAPTLVQQLGIEKYFTAVLTPKICGGLRGKPQRDMWEYIMSHHTIKDSTRAVMIGDDPWSDGDFAQNCNITCWLLDRNSRFSSLSQSTPYRWAKSLNDIIY